MTENTPESKNDKSIKVSSKIPKGVFHPFIYTPDDPNQKAAKAHLLKLQAAGSNETGFSRTATEGMADDFFGGDVLRTPLLFVDPLFDPILLMFPKENLKELYRRLRHYYTYNPFVRNLIDLHAEFALSDFELRCNDKEIERFYNEVKEDLGLLNLCIQMNRDYWLLGESFIYGNWSDTDNCWSSFRQLPPENVDIKRIYIGDGIVHTLKHDDDMKKMLTASDGASLALAKALPTEYVKSITEGTPYILDNNRLIHFARKPAEYLLRGDSVVKSILKDLLYEDKLRLLQYTFVDRHTHPIKLWKIGSETLGWKPSDKTLQEFRNLLSTASNDPDGNLVTHPFVKQEFVTTANLKEDLIPHFKWTQMRILAGLFATDAMVGGSVNPYANQSVSLKIVMHRYLANRLTMEKQLRNIIFRRLAVERGFYVTTEAEIKHRIRKSKSDRELDLPKFFWQKVNLLNDRSEQELLIRLREKGEIPFEIIGDVFGWDVEKIAELSKKEGSTPLDPAWRKAKDEALKMDIIKERVLKGEKLDDILSDTTLDTKGGIGGALPPPSTGGVGGGKAGRPVLPEGEKKEPEKAMTSNTAVPAREKATEAGTLPTPKGETPAPESL